MGDLPETRDKAATPPHAPTRDAFLGGRVLVLQPARGGGHRSGLDAVYLAAAVPEDVQGHVVDLGSGVARGEQPIAGEDRIGAGQEAERLRGIRHAFATCRQPDHRPRHRDAGDGDGAIPRSLLDS